MTARDVRIGVGMTGSFCTFDAIFSALKSLREEGADLRFVLSHSVQQISCRFTTPQDVKNRIAALSGHAIITTIEAAEPIGPNNLLDLFLIAPCTGNTLAKLANGITDSPVLMAAKAHLRNENSLVIFLATNDALGANLQNIASLLNRKNIFFVPFCQDEPQKKPHSLVSKTAYLLPALDAAIQKKQLQPVMC
ncbi:MAG: dipicolinate synthase subunit B [Oscillospiraceae bacterium]|jgi:dipicolinate synthase subunit B|nr:dipicolinate synthase subunit B [Oscillospiraceae bacterium]